MSDEEAVELSSRILGDPLTREFTHGLCPDCLKRLCPGGTTSP